MSTEGESRGYSDLFFDLINEYLIKGAKRHLCFLIYLILINSERILGENK